MAESTLAANTLLAEHLPRQTAAMEGILDQLRRCGDVSEVSAEAQSGVLKVMSYFMHRDEESRRKEASWDAGAAKRRNDAYNEANNA